MTRQERIEQVKQAYPIDRAEVVREIRELEVQGKLHPENAVLVYNRINVLLEMLEHE